MPFFRLPKLCHQIFMADFCFLTPSLLNWLHTKLVQLLFYFLEYNTGFLNIGLSEKSKNTFGVEWVIFKSGVNITTKAVAMQYISNQLFDIFSWDKSCICYTLLLVVYVFLKPTSYFSYKLSNLTAIHTLNNYIKQR